jgi:hypothetical protein
VSINLKSSKAHPVSLPHISQPVVIRALFMRVTKGVILGMRIEEMEAGVGIEPAYTALQAAA